MTDMLFPPPHPTPLAVTRYNRRILHLMLDGWTCYQIYQQLIAEGADISIEVLHRRMRELRICVELASWVQEQLAAHVPGPPPPPQRKGGRPRGPMRERI